jgi:hypothetical protein
MNLELITMLAEVRADSNLACCHKKHRCPVVDGLRWAWRCGVQVIQQAVLMLGRGCITGALSGHAALPIVMSTRTTWTVVNDGRERHEHHASVSTTASRTSASSTIAPSTTASMRPLKTTRTTANSSSTRTSPPHEQLASSTRKGTTRPTTTARATPGFAAKARKEGDVEKDYDAAVLIDDGEETWDFKRRFWVASTWNGRLSMWVMRVGGRSLGLGGGVDTISSRCCK